SAASARDAALPSRRASHKRIVDEPYCGHWTKLHVLIASADSRPRVEHNVGPICRLRVGTEGHAQKIVEALFRQAMIIRKAGYPHPHHGILLVISQVRAPGPGGASDQSPRLSPAKLQHDVCCKIIGGIFLTS